MKNISKNLGLIFFALLIVILMNLNLVVSSSSTKDNLELSVLSNLAMADSESSGQCTNCVAGGQGTSSCTYTVGIVTWSVTCQSGYYACCKATGASCCA